MPGTRKVKNKKKERGAKGVKKNNPEALTMPASDTDLTGSSGRERTPEEDSRPGASDILQTMRSRTGSNATNEKLMEIHHPHSSHHPKGWKAYISEFLMLFLAITAGFFVENQREHYIEHQREKQYARSLYDDLKIDTSVIQRITDYKNWYSLKMDSLLKIIDSVDFQHHNELVYYFERVMTTNDIFTAQDVTYQQLQGSGNFRYIRNLDLYKQIADYYNLYDRYKTMIDGNLDYKTSLSDMESRLFNGRDMASMYNPEAHSIQTLYNRPDRAFRMIVADRQSINFFYINTVNRNQLAKSSVIWLAWLKHKAITILYALNKEYELEQ